jgi:hypothetical protein
MCVFCSAIPAAMTIGVSAKVKQNQNIKLAEMRGQPHPHAVVPTGRITALVVSGLVVCSVIYHTHQGIL